MIIPEKITEISRNLRKNMTRAEKMLWNELRGKKLGVKFLRQHPIQILSEDTGQSRCVIVDFYCHEKKCIIELDGSVHNLPEVFQLDRYKEVLLENLGYTVIRIKNEDIISQKNEILAYLKKNSLFTTAASFPNLGKEFR